MKIALVHDYIKEYGGAERVLEALHEIWPEAPVFTSVYLPQFLGPHRKRFDLWDIRPSFAQRIPFIDKLISPLRLVSPWIFESVDLTDYDVVMVSATGAYFPNLLVRKPETKHVCYFHTPPRYLYGYPTARNLQNSFMFRVAAGFFNHFLRQVDFLSAQRPDAIIANSLEVKKRIQKFYRREATVIYPPVDIGEPKKTNKSSYFLTGGRLARAKHIDLAIGAANKLKLNLKIFGKSFADYGDELKAIAGNTIEFVGEVSDVELAKLYQNAQAVIYPSEQEDFGIIPVEAQSYGVPVIGFNQAGIKETVIHGKTGFLFDELTEGSLIEAIKTLKKHPILARDCIANAKRFKKARFQKEIKDFVMELSKDNSYARTP